MRGLNLELVHHYLLLHILVVTILNTLRPRQNGRHCADDMFKCIFLNENVWILIEISLKFVPKGSINNDPALFQTMAWRRPGDKPLSEPMMVSSLTHICVTRPQWVNVVPSEQRHYHIWTDSIGLRNVHVICPITFQLLCSALAMLHAITVYKTVFRVCGVLVLNITILFLC